MIEQIILFNLILVSSSNPSLTSKYTLITFKLLNWTRHIHCKRCSNRNFITFSIKDQIIICCTEGQFKLFSWTLWFHVIFKKVTFYPKKNKNKNKNFNLPQRNQIMSSAIVVESASVVFINKPMKKKGGKKSFYM